MVTIKLAVLRHTRAKDGSYKIRISVGHKSETHYIVTRYRVSSLANFVNGTVVGQPDAKYINVKLRSLLNEYDQRLESIPNTGDLSCRELRDLLERIPNTGSSPTLQSISDEYCQLLIREDRQNYARIIHYMTRKFLAYTGGDILLSQITTATIDGYQHYLRQRGTSPSYTTMCMTNIRTLVNRAVKMQLVRYDVHPFLYWKATRSEPRELDIPVEDMRKFITYRTAYKSRQRAVDLFLLSYYLGGINLIDLIAYDFRGYREKRTIRYIRHKTRFKKAGNLYVEFTIPEEAYPLIDRYMSPRTGHLLDISDSRYRSTLNYIDQALNRTAELLCIERHVSYYTARKSFVQHGFELGIPLETLEYCIGQTMKQNRPIFNYVKIMRQHADAAIRQILDNVRPPQPSQAEEV